VSQSQYTVKLSDTAEAVYCELFSSIHIEGEGIAAELLRMLDEALDNLPITASRKEFQLAGKFSSTFRQKTGAHCFTYRPDEASQSILVIEISPLAADCQSAHDLLNHIVTNPQHKAARAALGIPEKDAIGAAAGFSQLPPIH
jgi:hypothetical protein